MKKKYPIKKEYFPYNSFVAPLNPFVIKMAHKFLKVPSFLYKDKDLNIDEIKLKGYKDEEFSIISISLKQNINPCPAMIFIHGGGFIFDGSEAHFRICVDYAKKCRCTVFYIKYNLAPEYPFPYPQYECYEAYKYIFEHSKELGIDGENVGITGDSAGGTLAVTSMLLAKENNFNYFPKFQLLVYPWLDNRRNSESNKKYTDTPMWNSSLSEKATDYTNKDRIKYPPYINSPVEYHSFYFLPEAYIEVAQFDCLHDDGVLYRDILLKEEKEVIFHEVEGTMHGYETKYKAKTTQEMINLRVAYINSKFY